MLFFKQRFFFKNQLLLFFVITHINPAKSFGQLSSSSEDVSLEAKDLISETKNLLTTFNDLTKRKRGNELELLQKSFRNLDTLFGQSRILIQRLDESENVIYEEESDLHSFLSGPFNLEEIIGILQKHIRPRIKKKHYKIITKKNHVSFKEAVHILWSNKIIDAHTAREVILKTLPMSPKEVIKLIENGIAKTKKNFLVQLKTGEQYGNVLDLNGKMALVIHKLNKRHERDLEKMSVIELLSSDLRKEVIEAFDEMGLSGHDVVSDAFVLEQLRSHLIYLSTSGLITWFKPDGVGAGVSVDPVSEYNAAFSPASLSAVIVGNHYMGDINASMGHVLSVDPLGISYSGSFIKNGQGADWWVFYSDGYLGGGGSYTANFDKGALWSNGEASYLTFGGFLSGWRDRLNAGVSLQTLLANGIGVGVNAMVSVSRSHDVTYLGEYPIDGKIASIRGLRKIEISDKSSVGARVGVSLASVEVPLRAAFRAGKYNTSRRVYRTHTDLVNAQELMQAAHVPGILLIAGKKIKKTINPQFDKPEELKEGDELIEVKGGTLNGAFVLGIESLVPISAARIGGSVEMTAEFELGLKRLPNNKFEVSIEPKRVKEMGIFAGALSILGASNVKGMALARKQIFMFDFNKREARKAYFNLVHYGQLPTMQEIEVYTKDRGPEHLLTEFRAQNEELRKKGVQRTFLEKVQMATKKKYFGIKVPLIPAVLKIVNAIDHKLHKNKEGLQLSFAGIDREFLTAHAESVATNGIISVTTNTYGGRCSKGQGSSGRYNEDVFVTHRRLHSVGDNTTGYSDNRWQFDSLIIHAQAEDTKITENEENEMADRIGRMFGTFFGNFELEDSKSPRVVNLERNITRKELAILANKSTLDLISHASSATNIKKDALRNLIERLHNKHPDKQGLLVKEFIEKSPGFSGFAAIHQLLGADPKDLFIYTESGYMAAVKAAETFLIRYSNPDEKHHTITNSLFTNEERSSRDVKKFFDKSTMHLNKIDQQLRLLNDDKYLIDQNSYLNSVLGKNEAGQLVELGVRQDKTSLLGALISTREAILDLRDLKRQGFKPIERLEIYTLASKKRLNSYEKADLLLQRLKIHPLNGSRKASHMIKTYSRIYKIATKLEHIKEKLKNDDVMKELDPCYIKRQINRLNKLSAKIEPILMLKNNSISELKTMKRKIAPENISKAKKLRLKKHDIWRFRNAIKFTLNEKIGSKRKPSSIRSKA